MAYLGLETIRRGNSAACIKDIFAIHFPQAHTVLDCTYGAGRFWKWDHTLTVTGVDIDPPGPVSLVADYRQLPFSHGQFDVMVFDPPFLFGQSKGLRRVIGTRRFFAGAEAAGIEDRINSKIHIQLPKNPVDLIENHYRRIFEQVGIAKQGLICKGQNLIVGAKPDFWLINMINLAREMGLGDPADYLIQMSSASRMVDPRWQHQHHFRRRDAWYVVWKHASSNHRHDRQ